MGGTVADNFDWGVVIDLATKGGAKSVQDIDQVEEAVKRLSKANDLNETQEDKANKATAKRSQELTNATSAAKANTESLNAQRYALYEVAAAYGAVSVGLVSMGSAAVSAFADMESGFTKVERTSGMYGDSFAPLEADILSLARSIPTLTGEIQDLAARGAQMGIAADEVAGFSEVMAKFVATSPEVDVNSVAEAFGRLSNLTGTDDFLALASSIAKVGVNSAATDAQIIKTTQELARATNSTSLAADEVIGLAAAFASLGVAPEAARGVMNQFFTQLDKGAAGANDSMAAAAQVIGTTEAAAAELFKTNAGEFFQQFVQGLSGVESITLALDAMGLQGQRLLPAFKALASDTERNAAGQSVLAKALRDSNEGFRERTELDKQYAPIADDLASKQIILANSVKEMAYTMVGLFGPAIKGVMDLLIGATQAITDFTNTPFGGWVVRTVAALGALVAVYSALRSAIALARAMQIAFNTALGSGVATGMIGNLKQLIAGFRGTAGAAAGAAGGVTSFSRALQVLGKATVIIGVVQLIVSVLSDIPGAAVVAGKALVWLGGVAQKAAQWIFSLFGMSKSLSSAMASQANIIGKAGQSMLKWGESSKKAESSTSALSGTVGDLYSGLGDVEGAGYDAGNALGGGGGLGGGAEKAAAKIRTLLDYAGDLSSVMSRAFEIRFSADMSADKITTTFNDLRKAAADAAERVRTLRGEIRDLNADIGLLQSDIKTQEYFLSIAVEYGDTKRAEAIQANLAKLQANLAGKQEDLTKKQGDLTEAQEANNKTLTGNTAAAVKNREAITGLVASYQDQLKALAASGLSQEELRRRTDLLRKDFIKQATQLGFNREELRKYEAGFDDAAYAIDNIPRDVTIDINANPAITALQELRAQIEETQNAMSSGGGGGLGGIGDGGGFGGFDDLFSPEEAFASGDAVGSSWFDGLVGWFKDMASKAGYHLNIGWSALMGGIRSVMPAEFVKFTDEFSKWFSDLPANVGPAATKGAEFLWGYFTTELPRTLGVALGSLSTWLYNLPTQLRTTALTSASGIWVNFSDKVLPAMNDSLIALRNWFTGLPGAIAGNITRAASIMWPKLADIGSSMYTAFVNISNWFRDLPSNIWNAVRDAASSIWSNFSSGFAAGASSTAARGGKAKGYAEGGYTGPGAKYQPAGIVHRGEYVIPKHQVNQRTGLPYTDALGKLTRGSQGSSYASGGFVGGGFGGVVDLSAASIQHLAKAVQPYLVLDGRIVGEVASDSFAARNRVGAN